MRFKEFFYKEFILESVNSDEEYLKLAQDPEKNKEELKQIVQNKASRFHYNEQYFHGTHNLTFKDLRLPDPNDVGFSRYGPAIYLANPNDQKTLNVYSKDGRILQLFVNTENFIEEDLSLEQVKKIMEHFDYNIVFKDGSKSGDYVADLNRLTEVGQLWHIMELSGHKQHWYDYMRLIKVDGIIKPFAGYPNGEVAVYNKKTIKSADLITYDDDGDIIPLSQRFDSSKDDIRY
jgi:hypothetical protein